MNKTEQAYRHAEGRCLDAMQALRRLASDEALTELRTAIRIIEDEHRRARREDRVQYAHVQPAPAPGPFDF